MAEAKPNTGADTSAIHPELHKHLTAIEAAASGIRALLAAPTGLSALGLGLNANSDLIHRNLPGGPYGGKT
jgi:hypothetical protein